MHSLHELFLFAGMALLNSNSQTTNSSIDLNTIINIALLALGVATLIYSIAASRIQRRIKDPTWERISDLPLLNIASKVQKRIQVLLDNKPVTNLSAVVIKVQNRGNIPIEATDFVNQRPFRFNFGGAEVLDAAILKTTSRPLTEDAKASFKWNSKQVLLGPLVLSQKDWVTFEVLLDKQPPNKVTAETRIIGVPKFRLWSPTKAILIYGSIFIILGTVLGFGIIYIFPNPPHTILLPFAFFFTLFLKSYNVSVPLTFISAYFFKTRKFKSLRSAIILWTIYAFLLALVGTISFYIFP